MSFVTHSPVAQPQKKKRQCKLRIKFDTPVGLTEAMVPGLTLKAEMLGSTFSEVIREYTVQGLLRDGLMKLPSLTDTGPKT
jgi:hypothetical protein